MPDLSWLLHLASLFPLDGMDMRFMQQALVALVLLVLSPRPLCGCRPAVPAVVRVR